ncbi:MXAN_0125 family MYXO-CTERM protein [Pyxidicoccus sp. 3LG]
MRRIRSWARGVGAWLGLLGLVSADGALAESQPCRCSTQNQRVVTDHACLIIRTSVGCSGESEVTNGCGKPVTLVAWPLRDESCQSTACTQELQPGHSAYFNFAERSRRSTNGFVEDAYTVRVDGQESPITISADVTCSTVTSPAEGCASAPGTLAALGMLLLVLPVMRKRRSPAGHCRALFLFGRGARSRGTAQDGPGSRACFSVEYSR